MNLNNTFYERDLLIKRSPNFEEDHQYIVMGDKTYTSVTELCERFFEEFNADQIIGKFYKRWQSNRHHKYYEMSKTQIKEFWEKEKTNGAKRGSIFHSNIEDNFKEIESLEKPDPELWQGFLNFLEDHPGIKPQRLEWAIFDEDFKVAGSLDALMSYNGKLILLDWKQNKNITQQGFNGKKAKSPIQQLDHCDLTKYQIQINIYRHILESKYDIPISAQDIVWFNASHQRGYRKFETPRLETEIKSVLECNRIKNLEL
ncbi:hypothetical protein HOK68_03875 [Candidatus Woesearchaeota archaeon]|jgi:ATP-dependent exoDNAse (exonuclease V) beta subunit|nr:hypothetical protein [Candidatus Woesearchaeota archaeon]MBT4387885.1 hypothetical protein [Candidatus Woesearchaeota archaeon]MBT4595704.1 hypothetical protein [Candidatus Woesearchaeota archaeon]MBT5741447.1 hypothetical protein [Candidatus Woesearchaeota archaeon]MBT6505888.1 hypothetical protein [Candidatus Woesearchaeota archaeon]